jgi:CheY-like chemotaxis protein
MAAILVVDDSAVDRQLVGGLLSREPGWTISYADNGAAGLAKTRAAVPDVVVTDLQMPDMDGLELVDAIRMDYPDLPVVLITAYGSELLAVEALKHGAASYVPKSHLAEMLPGTVREVLALARANRSNERLMECLTRSDLHFSLRNEETLIDVTVDLIQQMLTGVGLCDAVGRLRVGVAVDQALRNALYHGNLEMSIEQIQEAREELLRGSPGLLEERRSRLPYAQRKIFVDLRIGPEEARVTVRDEGPGFDVAALLARDDAAAIEANGGRGLVLMRSFMDEVTFNGRGNEVTLVKRKDQGEAA